MLAGPVAAVGVGVQAADQFGVAGADLLAVGIGVKLTPDPDGYFVAAGGNKVPCWQVEILMYLLSQWRVVPVYIRDDRRNDGRRGSGALLGREGVFDLVCFTFLQGTGALLARSASE